MTLPPLHSESELAAVVSSIAGSTAHRRAEAAAFMEQALKAAAGRALAARRSAELHAAPITLAIKRAAGLAPLQNGESMLPLVLDHPDWPVTVKRRLTNNPKKFGLEHPPRLARILAEWERIKGEAGAEK